MELTVDTDPRRIMVAMAMIGRPVTKPENLEQDAWLQRGGWIHGYLVNTAASWKKRTDALPFPLRHHP